MEQTVEVVSAFPYAGRTRAVGEEISMPRQHASALQAMGRVRIKDMAAEDASLDEPAGKRRYKRRDMQAES